MRRDPAVRGVYRSTGIGIDSIVVSAVMSSGEILHRFEFSRRRITEQRLIRFEQWLASELDVVDPVTQLRAV